MNPTIVVVAFNRPKSLKRLLQSLNAAHYGQNNINLVISVDYQNSFQHEDVLKEAHNFEWKYGEKCIIAYDYNLGLKEHVLRCGDLTLKYESIIVLEDDLVVSKNFYNYALQSILFYKGDNNIASISLYHSNFSEGNFIPFIPQVDGFDNYFMQIPSSWGQIWTNSQWKKFREYYKNNNKIKKDDILPQYVKYWPDSSWKKYFFNYIINKEKYVVYPISSHSTNFNDIGTHITSNSTTNQTPLSSYTSNYKYEFSKFSHSANIYDYCCERHLQGNMFRFNDIKVELDLYGNKNINDCKSNFIISSKKCKKSIKSYPLIFSNILDNIESSLEDHRESFFFLGEKEDFINEPIGREKVILMNKLIAPSAYYNGVYDGKRQLLNFKFIITFLKKIISGN